MKNAVSTIIPLLMAFVLGVVVARFISEPLEPTIVVAPPEPDFTEMDFITQIQSKRGAMNAIILIDSLQQENPQEAYEQLFHQFMVDMSTLQEQFEKSGGEAGALPPAIAGLIGQSPGFSSLLGIDASKAMTYKQLMTGFELAYAKISSN